MNDTVMTLNDFVWFDEVIASLMNRLDFKARQEFRAYERWSLFVSMKTCGMKSLPNPTEDFDRASMDCVCKCGQLYSAHPLDWRIIGHGHVPFLNVLCDGKLVKL